LQRLLDIQSIIEGRDSRFMIESVPQRKALFLERDCLFGLIIAIHRPRIGSLTTIDSVWIC